MARKKFKETKEIAEELLAIERERAALDAREAALTKRIQARSGKAGKEFEKLKAVHKAKKLAEQNP
jgi:hypothetical protein